MLKVVCALMSVLFFTPAFSQISRGSTLIGANFSLSKWEVEYQGGGKAEQKFFQAGPSISFAVKENLVAGLDVSYGGTEYDNEAAGYMTEAKELGAGLFLRKYKPASSSFLVFFQGRVGYTDIDSESGSFTNPAQRSTTEGSNVNLSFVPGVSYKAGKSVLVELGINSLLSIDIENTETTSPSFGTPEVTKNNSVNVTTLGGPATGLTLGVKFIF